MNIVAKSLASFSAKSLLTCSVHFQHRMLCICFSCLRFQGLLLEKGILPLVIHLYLSPLVRIEAVLGRVVVKLVITLYPWQRREARGMLNCMVELHPEQFLWDELFRAADLSCR